VRAPRGRHVLILALCAAGLAGGAAVVQRASARALPRITAEGVAGAPTGEPLDDATRRDADIALYESALKADPFSGTFRTRLAALYMDRARETGLEEDVLRAEQLARASLAARTQHNASAFATLATTLLAQHRFIDARDVARQLVAGEPGVGGHEALLGEIELELGDYAAADRRFGALGDSVRRLGIAPRAARWEEVNGRPGTARFLLEGAWREARTRDDLPRMQVAWFALRLGDFERRQGRHATAERILREGLALAPSDHRLLAELARVAADQGRWSDAIDLGERATAVTLDPSTLGLVSDAYAVVGDSAASRRYAAAMETAVLGQQLPFHRAWSLFLLDRHRQVPEVARRARSELRTRRDVYGYDLMAWALHQQGRAAEARAFSDSALMRGTRDAMLWYHAGMIARTTGDDARSCTLLSRALALNAHFHPSRAAAARATRDSIVASAGAARGGPACPT
jgi:tetratricopeptide (TPR) repeat protein